MFTKPRFVKCGSYYYNINITLPSMSTGVSFGFSGNQRVLTLVAKLSKQF